VSYKENEALRMHHQIFSSRNNSQGQRADIFGENTFKIISSLFRQTV
jgi:hypothetical protein